MEYPFQTHVINTEFVNLKLIRFDTVYGDIFHYEFKPYSEVINFVKNTFLLVFFLVGRVSNFFSRHCYRCCCRQYLQKRIWWYFLMKNVSNIILFLFSIRILASLKLKNAVYGFIYLNFYAKNMFLYYL